MKKKKEKCEHSPLLRDEAGNCTACERKKPSRAGSKSGSFMLGARKKTTKKKAQKKTTKTARK